MTIEYFFALIGVGILVGFINTLAGSGSLLSLPLLMWMGLPATIANGTNRIGVLLQSITASASFSKHKVLHLRHDWKLGALAVAGSIVGALIAVDVNDAVMTKIIGIVMLVMIVPIVFKPSKWMKELNLNNHASLTVWNGLSFFLIGVYGGFIQAGVGIFLLIALVMQAGYDMVRANAIKVFVVLLFTPFALVVFIVHNQVDYLYGFVLAIGNIVGAYIGAKTAINKGAAFLRWFLAIIILLVGAKLIFFPEW